MKSSLEILKRLTQSLHNYHSHDGVMKNITITQAGPTGVSAEFKVAPEHLNGFGLLHGGFAATIIDNFSIYSMLAEDLPRGGSVDLQVSYVTSAKEGDDVVIESKATKVGKSIAYLECLLKHKKDGTVIAFGGQTFYFDPKHRK